MDDHEPNVAIFWDYENCTPPCSVPGYDIVSNIREIAQAYGSVKSFKAYLELSEQSSLNSNRLRSELQSCGISLTDCPHNGRKDVADKMMIVDMLTYAIDTPAPATLVLISGDRDFVYAVSVLRWRKYRVVLVAPNSAHCSLRSQASATLDWEYDILGKTKDVGRRASDSTVADTVPARPRTSNDSLHRRPQFSAGYTPTPSTDSHQHDRRQSLRGFIDDAPDVDLPQAAVTTGMTSPSTRPTDVRGVPNIGGFNVISGKPTTRNVAPSTHTTSLRPAPMMSVSDPPPASRKHTIQAAADFEDSGHTADLNAYLTPLGGFPYSGGLASHPTTSTSSEGYNALRRAPPKTNVTNIITGNMDLLSQDLEETKPTRTDSRIFANPHRSPLSSDSSGPPTPSDITHVNGENGQKRAWKPLFRPEDHLLCGSGVSPRCTAPQTHVQCRFGLMEPPKAGPTPITTVSPTPLSPTFSSQNRSFPVSRGPVEHMSTGRPSQAHPSLSESHLPPVPPEFATLIGLLEKHRACGVLQPLRTTVACALVERDRAAYQSVGVQRWSQYAPLAVSAGIIKLGGWQAAAWVSLEPAWYGRVTLPSRQVIGGGHSKKVKYMKFRTD